MQVVFSIIVSVAPPARYATTGRPDAIASSGTIPKSSSCGKTTQQDLVYKSASFASLTAPTNRIVGPANARSRFSSTPVPAIISGHPRRLNASITISNLLYATNLPTASQNSPGLVATEKRFTSTGGGITTASAL